MALRARPNRAREKEISTLVGKPWRSKIVSERDQLAALGELKPGFFTQLARDAFLQGFPNLQSSAWYGPFASEGLAAAADE